MAGEMLQTRRNTSVGASLEEASLPSAAREYVHSMHQSAKATLLYGKNNVSVCPPECRQLLKGYLSLHQNGNGSLSVKWTPNELMHSESVQSAQAVIDRNKLWRYALHIAVEDIVYLHFHQRGSTGGSVVLVGADGIQHPPIHFPVGHHPLAFLSSLENGLLPWGQLDPPLWLHRGKGKVLPKLRRRSTVSAPSNGPLADRQLSNGQPPSTASMDADETGEDEALTHDYVFRVVPINRPGTFEDSGMGSPVSMSSGLERNGNGASSGPPSAGLVSSRLVALSSLSAKLKDRFLSLSSSPTSSPPPTPRSGDAEDESAEDGRRVVEHESVQKRFSEPVFSLSERETRDGTPVQMLLGTDVEDGQLTDSSLKTACDYMRYQIISRAFYGWLAHCRHLKTIREHLSCLVNHGILSEEGTEGGLTTEKWASLREQSRGGKEAAAAAEAELQRLVYFGGIADGELRPVVWPYLCGWVPWLSETEEVARATRLALEEALTAWMAVEAIVRQRDKEQLQAARAWREKGQPAQVSPRPEAGEGSGAEGERLPCSLSRDGTEEEEEEEEGNEDGEERARTPEEGEGSSFSPDLIDAFALNLHRIEKDVQRCDRNHPYFAGPENLEKLKNLMCSFVWGNLETGYIQGMCDIAAPLLVVLDDEVAAFGCFCNLMERMAANFPHAGGMDANLANMRSLIQVMDPELFDLMRHNGDYTHFYFCYRWFLLDFKRELSYADVLRVWETTWAARVAASPNFILFLALALLLLYRPIILDNNMDFTDIIKFYNEMAEKHDATLALQLARAQVARLQLLIQDDLHKPTNTPV